MAIKKAIRDEIVQQCLQEITHARLHKQGKIQNWQKNEAMYYGKKVQSTDSRANIELGRMQEFVHAIMAKIRTPLLFKYGKTKEAQAMRVEHYNGLIAKDRIEDSWDIKDMVGKKQATIYGRTVYAYYATSDGGYYCPHNEPLDVYNFLIDPAAGGIDIDNADYLGDYGVRLNRVQLERGVRSGLYIRQEVEQLLEGSGNATESSVEKTNAESRTRATGVTTTKRYMDGKDRFVFWRWYTTFRGKRYYLLLTEKGQCIRLERLTSLFTPNKKLGDAMWPYWSWAPFPDLTEFWTPGYCDFVREVFMAQAMSVNQSFDNSEEVTKPTRVVNVKMVDPSTLKYKRGGQNIIKVKESFDIRAAVQSMPVASIDTPIKMFELLEAIQEKSSGVTAGAKGVAGEDKVGIYEGNQANAADRFGLLNMAYGHGYLRMAKLYEIGIKDHLTKKVAVDILGPDGIRTVNVSRRDLYPTKSERYSITIESSDADVVNSMVEKRTRLTFLNANAQNPAQNPKKAYEMGAKIAGFSPEEIRQLMDTSDFGDSVIMGEAERDIERIMAGEMIPPNPGANTAYKQRFVDFMSKNQDEMSAEDFTRMANYVMSLDEVIMQNMARTVAQEGLKAAAMGMAQQAGQMAGGAAPPIPQAPAGDPFSDVGEPMPSDAPLL